MLWMVRIDFVFIILSAAGLAGCGASSTPVARDPTQEPWYRDLTGQLTGLNRDAQEAFREGKADRASELILQGAPLAKRLLDVPRPATAAMEAASDLDDLYGRMLLSNRHYGWARLQFQKNLARWKNWTPQTAESERRLKQATDAIAECDRSMH